MSRGGWWLFVALVLFVAAWTVALLGSPQGEMGRVLLSGALAIGAILALGKSGRLS